MSWTLLSTGGKGREGLSTTEANLSIADLQFSTRRRKSNGIDLTSNREKASAPPINEFKTCVLANPREDAPDFNPLDEGACMINESIAEIRIDAERRSKLRYFKERESASK